VYPWFLISARILYIDRITIAISHSLVHNSTIFAEHKVNASLSISPCHDHEFTPSTAYIEHQHTPSTSIHQVQVLLATGLGNLPAVRVLTSGLVRFGSRPGEKPDLLCLGGFVTLAAVPLVPFLHLSLKLSIWVLIVSWHDQYVDCAFLAALSLPAVKFGIGPIFVELLQNNA